MSADLLRSAAVELRRRANLNDRKVQNDSRISGVWLNSAYHLTMTQDQTLAVADWLDLQAADLASVDSKVGWVTPDWTAANEAALTAARLLLGEADVR